MNYTSWVTPAVTILLGGGGLFGVMKWVDSKISRVYGRVDEIKKSNDEKYPSREVCTIQHKTVDEKLDRIETKVDKLLNGYKAAK